MSNVTFVFVDNLQHAREIHPNQPVILVWVHNIIAAYSCFMRYCGEFYPIDTREYYALGSTSRQQQWCIAGIRFTDESIAWMFDKSIAYPFSTEDLVLYQLTWGDCHD